MTVEPTAGTETTERRVWSDDGRSTEVFRQVGWHGQSGRFYALGTDYIDEPGSFSPVWECVDVDLSSDRPVQAGRHAQAVMHEVFGDDREAPS